MVLTKDYYVQFPLIKPTFIYHNNTLKKFPQALLSKFSKVGDPRPRSPGIGDSPIPDFSVGVGDLDTLVVIQKYCQNTVENADSEIASGYARVMHGIFQPMADLTFVNSHNLTIF